MADDTNALAGQQGEARPAPAESEALTKALNLGAQMANVCFNLKQDETLRERVRESLTDLQKQWDANILAARAALATQPAPEAEPAGERVGTVKVIGLPDSTVLGTSTSYSQEALRRLGTGEHNLHAAHPSPAPSGERDTLRALLRLLRTAMLLSRAHVRWLAFGECRSPGWDDAPPTAAQADAALCDSLDRIDAALADGGAK